jgi:2-polyprenyl-3-methyl-5-hydroxy-6-metoxy-1,4-benzoquinol methylase
MFSFGKNWKTFVRDFLDDDRMAEAEASLKAFLLLNDLKGKSFVDVGCGSGVFSLTAKRLRADRIVSFDVDKHSVECCEHLRRKEQESAAKSAGSAVRPEPVNQTDWQVMHGDVLDRAFLSRLGKFDVVYSWGVLHHTGSMWQAISNAAELVAPGGLFYIALYNRVEGWHTYPDGRFGPSAFWRSEKRLYCAVPELARDVINTLVTTAFVLGCLATFRNPVRIMREHQRFRGMAWSVDMADWLGGYPYEYAGTDEVVTFCEDKLGLSLERLKGGSGLLNNEYLFRRGGER